MKSNRSTKTCFFFCNLPLTAEEIRNPTTNYPYPRLIRHLCQTKKWKIYVFALGQEKPEHVMQNCTLLPYRASYWFALLRKKIIPDLTVMHLHGRYKCPLASKIMFGTPLIFRTGGVPGTQKQMMAWHYPFTRMRRHWVLYRFCDYYVSTADGTPVHLHFKRMRVKESSIRVWPNGFRPMSDRKYERKNWILYLGRIHRVKAVDYIVEAFKLALPQLPPDYKLILCGVRNRQTPFEQELRKSIETSSIASRVEFHPWTTDAEKYYKQSRMLITGCANNQIIEAYACGTPVIALDLGETKNIYGHLKNVHIVEYPLGGYPTNAQEPSIDPECVDRVTRDTAELIKMISQQKNSYDIPMIDYDAVGWEQRLSKEAELYDMALRRRPLVRSVVRKASTVILKALFFCSR